MVRTEISLFLKNEPGELGRLATLMGEAGINIDALTIQDASAYVLELFKARGKSLKRIASAAGPLVVSHAPLERRACRGRRPDSPCAGPYSGVG